MDETTPTADTSSPFMRVGSVTFGAFFGFDRAVPEIRDVIVDGTPLPPTFLVYLGSPDWSLGDFANDSQ